jgi:hypothetical protein
MSPLLLLLASAVVPMVVGDECYLGDPAATCALCWTKREGEALSYDPPVSCGQDIKLQWLEPPSAPVLSGHIYAFRYTVAIDRSVHRVVPRPADDAAPSSKLLWDVQHANVHACRADVAACTPFVDPSDLVTHTGSNTAQLDARGRAELSSSVALSPGGFTIIAHVRYLLLPMVIMPSWNRWENYVFTSWH